MKSSKPKDWTEIERQKLAAMARRRLTASEIAQTLDRHVGSVRRAAREMKLILKK
jgi:IS30 family transposase